MFQIWKVLCSRISQKSRKTELQIINFSQIPLKSSYTAFPGGSMVKNLPTNAGEVGLTLGLGRFPGGGSNKW